MKGYKKQLGCKGEAYVKQLCLSFGYVLIASNFRAKNAEIDLIFKDNDTLVFIEVKTRRFINDLSSSLLVSLKQQSKIKFGAALFLNDYNYFYNEVRFDVVLVSSNFNEYKYIESAF